MNPSEQGRRSILIVLGVVALAIVAVLAIAVQRGPMEDDLTRRADGALASAGINGVVVEFEGRDATLSGSVMSEGDRLTALQIIDDLEGVRVVDGLIAVAAPVTTTTEAPVAAIAGFSLATTADGGAVLIGTVPTPEDADAIADAASAVYGDSVDSQLVIDASTGSPPWLTGLPDAIRGLRGVAEPSLEISDESATVGGTVASEARIATVMGGLGALGMPVENNLSVAGAPDAATASSLETELNAAVSDASILFATGSTEIATEGSVLLDRLARLINRNPGARIQISGHTDDVGDPDGNLALSQARADSVANYLIDAGVDPVQVTAIGFGETQPIADNSTEEGQAANRRIEFTVEGAG
ncbi:OmpA family protein [bacterium]|nr:OmpA family protein [bacterium]